MKYLIASDIHGSAYWMQRLLERIEVELPDRVVLLGDLLYHGPRNDLPRDYAPKEVIEQLKKIQPAPLCVRGNCDAEVDQMVLSFPIMADYGVLSEGEMRIYFTHGHVYNRESPLPLQPGDVLLCGHFHVPACELQSEGWWYLNPGSVSIPKENSMHQYLLMEDGVFTWKDLNGQLIRQEILD